jgi:predicted glycogen debranching enzyme
MIEFGQDVCGNLEEATKKEWLETNGLGGFASSTIIGLNTRRYHALLTAATKPPVGRIVMLSKLEETLIVNRGNEDERYDLSANQYSGVIHPQGYQYLKSFRLDPFPIFSYEIAGVEIEKVVFMVHGENTTVAQYACRKKDPSVNDCRLEIRPLIAFRDFHATTHENNAINSHVEVIAGLSAENSDPGFAPFLENLAAVKPYADQPGLYFAHDADEIEIAGYWYRNFEYRVEQERGLDFIEDLFNPVTLKFDLNKATTVSIIASLSPKKAGEATRLREAEIARRRSIMEPAQNKGPLIRAMTAAADQFIAARSDQKTVIAGYHWFSDWGRDTMIALPGLTLTTGRYDIAKSILLEFARHIDHGMLPNRFPDVGEQPEYNTVDATLWYFEAIRALTESTGDFEFTRQNLYPALLEIIDWHERGTRYNIHLDQDGLLFAGEPGAQLTWMDAKIGDWVVTPRAGKPVEIQALWYNALRTTQDLARSFGDAANYERFNAMAARAKESFNRRFWNEEAGCLYDVVDGESRDGSIRPNQVLAISLRHTMLDAERAGKVLKVVERELLTPLGLRSLAPNDPRFIGRYTGDMRARDGAYHQGAVWAWLIGPFISAYLRVNGNEKSAVEQARAWLAGFNEHLLDAGLGQISEIFDGAAPHTPCGCIAQAWSVAEILRVAVEVTEGTFMVGC